LKTIFVMMRVEEAELLAAVDSVEGVVDVERDALWNALERKRSPGAILAAHGVEVVAVGHG
jgi:hypothetical protein